VDSANAPGPKDKKVRYGFVIYKRNGKKYFLFAATADEANAWIQSINESLEEAKKLMSPQKDSKKRGSLETQTTATEEEDEETLDTIDYPFDEPDSAENIVFVDPAELPNEPGGANRSPDDPPLIKAASLPKLVERLAYDDYSGLFFSFSLLAFISSLFFSLFFFFFFLSLLM
jgi:hypothetical protein